MSTPPEAMSSNARTPFIATRSKYSAFNTNFILNNPQTAELQFHEWSWCLRAVYSGVMIWYLLYPFRGTTEPPLLGPAHPLRCIFTQHGRRAARHPVIALLTSVAVAAILIYPFPFLYTNNFTNGSSNLPHHVWTAAQPYDGGPDMLPDVVMRSVWVHGSHMLSLEPHVLLAALEIQDELLGPTVNFNPRRARDFQVDEIPEYLDPDVRDSLHAINGLSNNSWFFHSPLLYWSCSSRSIQEDDNIIATVNERARQATSVNVTLRHSIVFSGKRFEDHRLVAADALVITLIHKIDSPVGRQWERQVESLARKSLGKWRLYPEDGRILASQLYEFRFKPLSFQDDLILGIAYGLALTYFLLSLTKLRALKSRLGLSVTVIAQIALSFMSSFTVCAVLKIDLSKIPREAYPLVVLTVGMENMFRLINALILTPPESPTAFRIGEALGNTGHVALAGVAQNLTILWLLGKVVSPGVAAFCHFAVFALLFDFLYLITFFVAVLSVEVRRTELSDSLERRGHRPQIKQPDATQHKQTWVDALLRGDLPISTRVSGTIVTIGFVLIAQWHFFENENPMQTLSRLARLILGQHKPPSTFSTQLSIDVNQARTPTAWLRLQDHETAREVIQVVKPNAHSYIARVYDPLIFVLEGSDRSPSHKGIRPFLPAAYDFIKHELTRFIMTVIFMVAAVSLFMNFLLWDYKDANSGDEDHFTEDEPFMAVKTLSQGHALDVVMLAASPDGVIVSVGLDRWIKIWNIRQDIKLHTIKTQTSGLNIFPLLAIAVDDHANWLALLSPNGQIILRSIPRQKWGPSARLRITGRPPTAFFFQTSKPGRMISIILIQSSSTMTEITFNPDSAPEVSDLEMCKSTLVCARHYVETSAPIKSCILTASQEGCLHIATQDQGLWASEKLEPLFPSETETVVSIFPLPQLQAFLAIRPNSVDLVEMETRMVVQTFKLLHTYQNSLSCLYSMQRIPQSGSRGIASFSLVYTSQASGDCFMQTYSPREENEVLCINPKKYPIDLPCCRWDNAIMQEFRMRSPGKWITLPAGVVVGVRKRIVPLAASNDVGYRGSGAPASGLRQRTPQPTKPTKLSSLGEDDPWEAWMLSTKGEVDILSLAADDGSDRNGNHLLASNCGPMTMVGQRSIAVGLGNVIKVITIGHERFTVEDGSDEIASAMSGRRRRPLAHWRRGAGSR